MKLSDIKGIGPVALKNLKAAGIESPLDLVCHFPHKYIDLKNMTHFYDTEEGADFAACGRLLSHNTVRVRKGLSYVKAEFLACDNIKFSATWFNQPFISRSLQEGKAYYILGKLKRFKNKYEISAPVLQPSPDTLRPVISVYKSTGVSKSVFESALVQVLKSVKFNGYLPPHIRQKFLLIDVNQAFISVHFPKTLEEAAVARRSLSIENLTATIALFFSSKQKSANTKPFRYTGNGKNFIKNYIDKLPYALTADQNAALGQILQVMDGTAPANILLDGDVGSGKTIVCMLAAAYSMQSGYQSVLMAPTELLARQHYNTATKIFGITGIELLTSSQTAAARSASKLNIENGAAKLIIGTHSVLQKDIIFKNVSLVVTDEQQRFGVEQRGALENKGIAPDSIVMSATPIPRTLALTLYGELQSVSIRSKPKGRAKIFTRFVGAKIKEMYEYILNKARAGEQAYIVCPRIEGDEDLTNAVELYNELQKSALQPYIALLHGQMKDFEKTAVMDSFVKGEKRVLVSTTIVEVGIDVPAATTMVVYNAERYGLSQLHQLRGRVGRGQTDSFCFLLSSAEGYQSRLKFLEDCDDGFLLAEKDFELRGAGDFLGTRQHGKALTFTGEPITLDIIRRAKEIASVCAEEFKNLSKDTAAYFNIALN